MKNSMRGKIENETNAWINENETIFQQMKTEQNALMLLEAPCLSPEAWSTLNMSSEALWHSRHHHVRCVDSLISTV
jgi:hypothetical protein